jgi:D-3-phosphoglycerate dehydrogenase
MAARPKALVLAPFSPDALDRLRVTTNVTYEPWTETKRLHNPQELAERIRNERVAAIVVEADFLVTEAFQSPYLRVAGACRNAVTQVDLKTATERGIPVLNAPGRNNVAVAELAIGFMFALARHVRAANTFVSGGQWTNPVLDYEQFRGREIARSTVGIIGLGQIGREVAQRARCLGAKVIAHDPFVSREKAVGAGARLVSLRALLAKADFVTLHTTAMETPILDAAALDQLRPAAYVINTGAPAAVDYDALAERLRTNRIAGAALDVFPGFIPRAESPILGLDNVILTPHIGGATEETVERHSRMMVEDIERVLRGERPRRVANLAVLKSFPRGR